MPEILGRLVRGRWAFLAGFSILVLAISCSLFLTASLAQTETNFQVTNTNDSGAGSLRDAIAQANSNPTDDTIDFAIPGCSVGTPCTITLTSGELLIANNGTLTVTGPGADALGVSGNNLSRVFDISPGAIVTISDLKITGGRTAHGAASVATGASGQDGTNGGGIYNDGGTLTLNNCNVSGNASGNGGNGGPSGSAGSGTPGGTGGRGGNGAGVYNNAGVLALTNTTVSGNTAGNGGAGGSGAQNGGRGGDGGKGAGLYSLNGSLSLTNSTVSGNNAGIGGPGSSAGFSGGAGGTGGDGGGLYADGSSPTVTNSTFSNNRAGNGGVGAPSNGNTNGGFGGSGGSGGAIYNSGGSPTLTGTTLTNNFSGSGANGGTGSSFTGQGGNGGNGAGLFNTNGILTIINGSVDNNHTGNGGNAPGSSFQGAGGGNGGLGGGIHSDGGTVTLDHLKVFANTGGNGGNAANGVTGSSFPGGTGGRGAGISINSGTITILSTSINGNTAGNGGDNGAPGGSGGGMEITAGSVTIKDSAVYNNVSGNGGPGKIGRTGGSGGNGGGILISSSVSLSVFNSTIAGNTCGTGNNGQTSGGGSAPGAGGSGGGIWTLGTLKTINATVTNNTTGTGPGGNNGNGGGIAKVLGTANIRNTIIALNNSPNGPDVSGSFASSGHNFIGNNQLSGGFVNGVNGDQVGTAALPKNPLLGPLQDNGGPTATLNLSPSSTAAEGGDNCVFTANGCGDNNPAIAADQRGLTRPQGAIIDIGAIEALPVPGAPDLNAVSDSGSNTDNLTNATNLQFQVTGAMPAATVELLRNSTVVATAIADGSGNATLVYTDNAADGLYNFTARNSVSGFASFPSTSLAVTIDRTAPTVTINQTSGQPDPTNILPINFTAVFSSPVTSFTNANVSLAGSTADVSGATIAVSGTGPTYSIAVSNVSGVGTVQASIAAAATTDLAGNPNVASTSTDNIVVFDNAPLTVTINQAATQTDPTSSLPINYTVIFSKPVLGFANSDVLLTGSTANVSAATINVTGGGAIYNVEIGNVTTSGTVIPSIPSNAAVDTAGNPSMASTSSDNSVTYDLPPPTVTINQAAAQADPTNAQPINFTVVFNEPVTGFTGADVSLAGSTADFSSATKNVSGSGTTYNVAISNLSNSGTVQASIPAGGAVNTDGDGNTISTSTDNTVTFDITPPSVTINQAVAQADPTSTEPLNFTVIFSEPVTGFTNSDISLAGSTAEVAGANIDVTGTGANYNVAISNVRTSGTILASIPANAAADLVGNGNLASTSTDNSIAFTTSVTDLVVNLTGDAGDGVCDATCTLRDAITTSNTTNGIKNVSFNLPACQPASPCTISLTSGELAVTSLGALNLAGPGANVLSISGNNQSRVFNLALNSLVTMSDLTITGGRAATNNNGGGILNGGVLTLMKVVINGNAAGGGSIGSFFSGAPGHVGGHGGGIYNDGGTVNLTNCTLSGNAAGAAGDGSNGNGPGSIGNGGPGGSGGGVFNNGGTVTVISSTFSGNTAGTGGAPGAQSNNLRIGYGGDGGHGGGIFSTNGALTIVNSTFSGNSGGNGRTGLGFQGQRGGDGGNGGAIYHGGGTLLRINNTISGNNAGNAGPGDFGASAGSGGLGGGIFQAAGTVRARNDIVAGNNAPGGALDLSGVFISLGHNFIGKADGATGFVNGINGDQVGSIAAPKDPLLGPLQDNGGATQTLNPAVNSGTIDAADGCVANQSCSSDNLSFNLATDQRGVARPQGAGLEIGAVEILPATGVPDLLDASDSGSSNTDNLTKETNLQFQVGGAQPGATVQLRRNATVVASATADGSGNAILAYADNAPDGVYNFTSQQFVSGQLGSPSPALAVTIDRTPPAVAINQATTQTDPASTQPIDFTAVFNEAVSGFTTSDVSLAGSTADVSAANIAISVGGPTYTVSVGNILLSGVVQASIPAGVAADAAGNGNSASTSGDNAITLNVPSLTVTIDQAAGQDDPTNVLPVNFTVVFSSPVSGFSSSGISLAGSTSNVSAATITVTGSGTSYNVAVGNVTTGNIQASVFANSAHGIGGGNQASTSSDNIIAFDTNPPSVTINQASGQADPTNTQPINFTAIFDRSVTGFSSSGVSLAGSTADVSGAAITITGSGAVYNVAVNNILSSGTVRASVLGNAATGLNGGNQASTSTDNTVTLLPTFLVNQTTDFGDGTCDATCTLRDAIGAANNTPGTKTIGFDLPSCTAATPCTLVMEMGPFHAPNSFDIANNGPLSITGPGADALIIKGSIDPTIRFQSQRVMTIASGATISISNLTITGGMPTLGYTLLDGGGIYNDNGNLTLTNVKFVSNNGQVGFGGGFCSCNAPGDPGGRGGAIYNTGSLTLRNCTFSNNNGGQGGQGGGTSGNLFGAGAGGPGGDGGAVYNAGTLTVINSTFNGNNAGIGGLGGVSGINTIRGSGGAGGNGGAIFNSGTLTFVNSTASGNNGGNGTNAGTHGNGGNGGNGGGILNNGAATVVNSTVANNNGGTPGVKGANGTTNGIPGNGGGIDAVSGSIYLRNTIVAKNTVGGTGPDLLGAFISLGHNFVGKFDGSTGFADGTNFDWVGSVALEKDPMLGPLQNNGGPTLTLRLAGNSPAKDAADNCVLDRSCANNNLSFNLITDERGVTRPQFAAVDIGAFEAAPALTVTTNQASAQADPVSTQPINFTVVFSSPVTGFTGADVSLAGSTANVSAASITVSGSGANYTVSVSNVSDGIVQASIPVGSAVDSFGIGNDASTSTDNTVTLDMPPSVTINQAGGQADPTSSQPINFTVIFNEPVTGFTGSDISLSGSTANVTAALVNVTGSGAVYTVAVSNITSSGTIAASIPAGSVIDTGGNNNFASTSTDNTVTLDTTQPTVTINRANGQADPTASEPINFAVVFSEPVSGFTGADVSLTGSTANTSVAVINVSGSGAAYTVSVSGLLSAGILQASIPANSASDAVGNGNTASTSTNNSVTYSATETNLVVNQTTDAGDGLCDATCTLRDAITTANSTPGIKHITFNLPSCTSGTPCTIALVNGELLLANNGAVTLAGLGSNVLTVSGNNQSRIFNISPNSIFSAAGLTLTAGFSGNGGNGGTGSNGLGDGLPGGDGRNGGAVYNEGALTLNNCMVVASVTGNGGNGGNGGPDGNPRPGGAGGSGGLGGGIYSTGNLKLNNSTITGNTTGNGGNGGIGVSGSSSGRGGAGGSGGGVYSSGVLSVSNTTSSNNTTGNGGNGADANGSSFSAAGGNGGGGGGIFSSGALNVSSSTVSGNHAGNGGTGGVNSGHNNGATGGSGGSGAGIFSSGPFVLTNSTVSDNVAGAGNFGGYAITFGSCPCGSDGAGGDGGSGGGIYSSGSAALVNNTISNNTSGVRGGGVANPSSGSGSPGSAGNGGGIAAGAGTTSIRNTIVYANAVASGGSGTQAFGTFVSLGHNLVGDPNGASGFGATGDLLNTNPLLGALQNNGGSTQTRDLDVNSPAKNSGDNCVLNRSCASVDLDSNLVIDQRGINRPQGTVVDIGAVEFSLGSSQTSLTSSPNPSQLNQTITFTASVTSGAGSPAGTVQFLDGGTPISGCTSVALASGQATCQTSSLALGDHTITAAYSGDGNFNPSNGSLTGNPQVVSKITPTFGLTSSVNPSTFAQQVSFTATLSSSSGTPTGTVQFLDGPNPIGGCNSVNVSSGQAVCQSSALSVASHTITAQYSGDATFSSSSANLTGNPQVVNQANVTVGVTSSLNPSVRGDQVTFTATISATGATPTGTVQFLDGVNPITGCSSSAVSNGQATCQISDLTIGNHTITAQYSGDGNFNGQSGSLSGNPQVVNPVSATFVLASAPNPSFTGSAVTLTATLTPATAPPQPASGSVTFKDGGNNISNCTALTLTAGQTQCVVPGNTFSSGSHNLTAEYTGDSNFAAVTSNTVVQQVDNCATNQTVTDPGDSGPNTLRQALIGTCEGGTINFNLGSGPHTITIAAELSVARSVNIVNTLSASNGRVIISGNNATRLFKVNSGASVVMINLTLTEGNGSGGDGGAIQNSGTLTLAGLTLNSNAGHDGGAIRNDGTLVILNSTLSGTSATQDGGAILNGAGHTLTLTNVTIAGNFAARNGGGVSNAGIASLSNTILARNTSTVSAPDVFGSFTSLGHNLVGKSDGAVGFSNGVNADQVGTIAAPIDPLLRTLADNGGGTLTHSPLPGSPVIDAGNNALLPTDALDLDGDSDVGEPLPLDQRGSGFARIINSTVDIGAVEVNYTITATAGTGQSATINTAFGTLLEATVKESGIDQNGIPVSFTPPASGAGGSFASSATVNTDSDGVARATAFTANGIAGGPYNVVGSLAGGSAAANFALTNTAANQTIGVSTHAPAQASFNDSFNVMAASSSGLPVSYSSSGSCTNVGPTFTINSGSGVCTVTYSQAGDGNFNAAPLVIESINAQKANQTINFVGLADRTFNGPDFTVSATATSTLAVSFTATGQCTINGATVHLTGAGPCTITAHQSGDNNFNAATDVTQAFNISKANQTISFGSLQNRSFGDADFAVSATATSNLAVSFTATGQCTINGATVHLTGAGSCTITAHQSGDNNFNAATDVTQAFNISKANQTISFGSLQNRSFGDADFAVSATATSNLAVSFTASGQCTINGATVHLTGAGSCTITAHQSGNNNFNAATDVPQSFSLSKANQTISFGSLQSRTFGDADFAVSATATSNLPVSFNASGQCTINGAMVHITGAGGCTITASQNGDTNFASAAGVAQTFDIAKANTTIAVSSSSNPASLGQSVTFTATVAGPAGAGIPTGAVQLKDNGANLGSPQSLNAGGVATLTTSSLTSGNHTITADYNADVNFNPNTGTLTGGQTITNQPLISLSQSNYAVNESEGFVRIVVNRSGQTTAAVSFDYATSDAGASGLCSALNTGMASSHCDFTAMLGTLTFAANQTQQTLDIPINQDSFAEGPELFTVVLSHLTGGARFVTSPSAIVTINDSASSTPNAIDDTETFVRQQYRDFLNREADPAGLAYWKNNIDQCKAPGGAAGFSSMADCLEVMRVSTSAAFFLSIEFQTTGNLVRSFYVAALDRPATNNMPAFTEFERDTQAMQRGVIVGPGNWQQVLDANRIAFMNDFVTRAEFVGLYPTTDTPAQYVDRLYLHANVTPTIQERLDAISEFGGAATAADTAARGRTLLRVTQHPTFQARERNRAFVQMQYFGYLRRNPNDAPDGNFNGYDFWLNKLKAADGNFITSEMVKAFVNSSEYRGRFGP